MRMYEQPWANLQLIDFRQSNGFEPVGRRFESLRASQIQYGVSALETHLLTVEEFLTHSGPKEGHLELHHREVVVVPPPKKLYQKIQDGCRRWVADVGCVSRERYDAAGDDNYLMGAPELVIEVLSPSDTVDEVNDKMFICTANGCNCFWVVDPKPQLVSVTHGTITRHYGVQAAVPISLPAIELAVDEIFVK